MMKKIQALFFTLIFLPLYAFASSPDIEYQAFARKANLLLSNADYTALDSLASTIRINKTRFQDGRWKLTAFYEGMHPIPEEAPKAVWDLYEYRIKQWIDQDKNIPTPYIALASFYIAKAWNSRGMGYANSVTDKGWQGWNKNLSLAQKTLNDSAKISQSCPHWYALMQTIALGQGWDENRYEHLFKEAVAKEPTYYFYYFYKANFYQSRWYGDKNKLKKFVNESVKSTFSKEGYTLYARIYWASEREFGNAMFAPGNVDWSKMKAGFEFINKHYPHSIWNQNAYAHFACRAGDKKTTADALRKIGGEVNLGAWSSDEEYEACKRWTMH